MNRTDLSKILAEAAGVNQEKGKAALDAVLNAIGTELKNGNKVQLLEFGTFSVGDRAERTGKNPKTGESIVIPAKKTVKFKASTNLI